MIIAVPYDNGNIFQHFGHATNFKLYDADNGTIRKTEIVSTVGKGHGALAAFLTQHNVETLICGGIGSGAQTALRLCGIKLCGGVTGSADDAVKQYLHASLKYVYAPTCIHGDADGHACSENGCGHHSCH